MHASSTILTDTFSDDSRTNQALSSSAAWYASKVGSDVTVVNQQLQISGAHGNSAVMAYFEPAGSPVTLNIGSTLQLSFDFSFSGSLSPQDRAFSFFLYNSGGNRLLADDTSGFNAPLFANYTGYGITYDPDSANPARYRTVERNGVLNNLLSSSVNNPLGTPGASAILTPGTTYDASLSLTRTASSITVSGNINGSAISNVDLSSSFTQFDTVVISAFASDIPGMTLDNIQVGMTAAPESSSCALFALGGVMIVLARIKRRRNQSGTDSHQSV